MNSTVRQYEHGGLITDYNGYSVIIRCYRSHFSETSWQWWVVDKNDQTIREGKYDIGWDPNPSEIIFGKVFSIMNRELKIST